MLITRKNLRAGRPLQGFPLIGERGLLGYKVGYCEGCNEPIVIRTIDVREIVDNFGVSDDFYKHSFHLFGHREPIKHRVIRWLGGEVKNGFDKDEN